MAEAADSTGAAGRPVSVMRLGILAVAGSLLAVVLHPVIGLPVAGSALVGVVYRLGISAALGLCVAGGLLTTLVSGATVYVIGLPLVEVAVTARAPYVFAAMMVCSLVLVGPAVAVLLRRASAVKTAAFVATGLSLLQVVALGALASGAGQGLSAYVREVLRSIILVSGAPDHMLELLSSAWPALLVSLNGLSAAIAVGAGSRAAHRAGAEVHVYPPLPAFDLDPRVALLPITAVALLAAGRLGLGPVGGLETAGLNLIVVSEWLFFVQGVAVASAWYHRFGLGRVSRGFGYALLLVTEALFPIVSLTGLADVWLNLRRLPREGAERPAVEGPRDTE